ncbi:MAG TPA: integration host factor subunit alpha [Smithella sp.]|nr:integration host factor subunit alpha [Smithella sp.]
MTKNDIVKKVYASVSGLTRREAASVVDAVFDTIKETLERGENVNLSGFGNFTVRSKKPRPGRNPKTGESIEIAARRVLTFKPSHLLKKHLNSHL